MRYVVGRSIYLGFPSAIVNSIVKISHCAISGAFERGWSKPGEKTIRLLRQNQQSGSAMNKHGPGSGARPLCFMSQDLRPSSPVESGMVRDTPVCESNFLSQHTR